MLTQSYGLYGAVNEKDGTDAMFPAKIAASLKSIHCPPRLISHFHSSSMKSRSIINCLVGVFVSSLWQSSSAFVAPNASTRSLALNAQQSDDTSCNRLTFLKTVASVVVAAPMVAFADDKFEDLAMPSADEQKAQDDVSKILSRRVMFVLVDSTMQNPVNLDYSQDHDSFSIIRELGMNFHEGGNNAMYM